MTEPACLKGDDTRRKEQVDEVNCLQQHRKWAEWEGKQAVAALHSVLMGLLPRP